MGRALHGWCLLSYIRKSEKKYGICCICGRIAFAFYIYDSAGADTDEKSGKTFGELVTNAKMKKARTLLRNSIITVENIAYEAGYQNVEHFNRQFKKIYGMTPLEYRNAN